MPRSSNQKLKLLYVMDFLLRCSDEEHPVTVNQIIDCLAEKDIPAERKSIYDDIEALRLFGLDVIQVKGGGVYGYYVGDRDFQLPELKLLVDSVQSSKFITHKKTVSLIKKIESLASVYQARQLSRQVFVANRIKTMNESIYYNVDEIHSGIAQNRQIRFRYFDYTVDKKRRFRREGDFYQVSPFALTWDDENYYMVAYDSQAQVIKHFRVDKMVDIAVLETERDGKQAYEALDMAVYARKVFGMFSGDERRVRLRFDSRMVGAVLDRLGRDAVLVPDGPDHFTVTADVVVSPQLFAWVFGFHTLAQIIGPQDVVEEMREYLAQVAEMYPAQEQ